MSDAKEGTSGLNMYLQKKKRLPALSWQDSMAGPNDAPTWTSVCKIDGEERGTGTAARKHLARNIAANVALASLREEDP